MLVLAVAYVSERHCVRAEAAQEATIDVAADTPGPAISPMLYGLMTEEMSITTMAVCMAELIRNRDFKEADKTDPTDQPCVDARSLVAGPIRATLEAN